MKPKYLAVLTLVLLLNFQLVNSQEDPKEEAKKTICFFWDEYQKDIKAQVKISEKKFVKKKFGKQAAKDFDAYENINQWLSNQTQITLNSKTGSVKDLEEDAGEKSLKYGYHNRKMIEKFKVNEISSYFGGVSSLAIQEFYASYNSNTKMVSLGKNSSLLGKAKLNRFDWILNTGLTIKTQNEFGTVIKDGELQRENITLNIGISKLAKGYVNFKPSKGILYKAIMVDHRDYILKDKMFDRVNNYIEKEFDVAVDSLSRLYRPGHRDNGNFEDELKKYAVARRNKYYSETASEEIKFLKGNSLYRSFETHWFTANLNVPFGNQTFMSSTSADNSELQENKFYAWNASAAFNYLWKRPKGASYIFNSSIGVKNNNNFLTGSVDNLTFQATQEQSENQQAIISNQTVFIGGYNEFLTFSGKIDVASLLISESIGLRLAYEKNFGDFDDSIFLAGIPVIVKEKGKPVVNLEFQYRRVNDENLWGLSTSLLLASLIR